jgi:glyoxylate/hydroxypyruvate reductase A
MRKTIPLVSRSDSAETAAWLKALQAAMPEFIIERFQALDDDARAAAQVAIVADPDPADLVQLPNLLWVQSLWAGVERIVSEMPDSSLEIVRLEDPQMAKTMAEAVLAWTLYLHRDMPRYRRQQIEAVWQEQYLPLPSDRTIGILGLGNLGRMAAGKLLEQEFNVHGWSRSGASLEHVSTHSGGEGLKTVLAASDIIVILMPLTEETRGLIDADALSTMRKGASLINFARGPIIDDDAILSALDSGHLEHAVLDVFDEEPLPKSSRFWSHPSVTVLPHISGPTNRTTASRIAADNIVRFFRSGNIPRSVNRSRGY